MQWLKDIALGLLLALIAVTLYLAAVAFLPPKVTPTAAIGFQRQGIEHIGRE